MLKLKFYRRKVSDSMRTVKPKKSIMRRKMCLSKLRYRWTLQEEAVMLEGAWQEVGVLLRRLDDPMRRNKCLWLPKKIKKGK